MTCLLIPQRRSRDLKYIKSPNVIKFYNMKKFDEDCLPFFEHGAKGSLDVFLKNFDNDTMETTLFLKKMRELATGLKAIHKLNIIHADIKSGNVVFDEKNVFKIIDFGSVVVKRTTVSELIGKPNYIIHKSFLEI